MRIHSARTAFLVVAATWYLAWLAKVDQFVALWRAIADHPVASHPLFPGILCAPSTSVVAYLAPVACGPLLLLRHSGVRLLVAVVMVWAALTLALSIDGHNDATFIVSTWTALWLLWLGLQRDRADEDLMLQGALLGQAIVALCFFGGVCGKLSPGWFSGERFLALYVERRPGFPWDAIRAHVSSEGRALLATIGAWVTLAGEALLSTLPLFSPTAAFRVAAPFLAMMLLCSTWRLFSVLGPLLGLLAVGALWCAPRPAAA